eukprot:TRINITY_DN36598_c1_g1_i2.p1 TRINITY_DN36598_c1_g1~~TRINITY_DN36598_c1_g1_i2.p1  ORF type:complete len:103 (-),score=2.07 TRINITY_DN36598_c1_g1_i2:87-395(-)
MSQVIIGEAIFMGQWGFNKFNVYDLCPSWLGCCLHSFYVALAIVVTCNHSCQFFFRHWFEIALKYLGSGWLGWLPTPFTLMENTFVNKIGIKDFESWPGLDQ